jgi:alkanesulfonate monooxygenase SsuD/methylene tetrahydromethanopterin reductase-like flavin-dependent oxidoreductase (luciferase family)
MEAEDLGFDVFNVVDHFYGLFDVMDPTHEAYTILGAIASHTSRIRLGVMVCGNTYRNPAFLLKQAVTVDHISNGRLDFGVGAGWLEREHEAYGFPFPSARERVDRFAEALEIWDLLQREERTTYDGQYYLLLDAPFEPKPIQKPRLPLLVGASGPRMLALTARHADIWNARGMPEEAAKGNARIDQECQAIERDPNDIVRSISPKPNFLESPDAFSTWVAAYREYGFTDFQIPWPRTDAEYPVLQQVAREVIPALRSE